MFDKEELQENVRKVIEMLKIYLIWLCR